MLFRDTALDSRLLRALDHASFTTCTPVQAQALPVALDGNDLLAQAQTGSGKTIAYLAPAFHLLLTEQKYAHSVLLVIGPTRELAQQVADDAKQLAAETSLKIAIAIGGEGYAQQISAIKDGAQCIVGTPGRLLDLIKRHEIKKSSIAIVVIDEADRLFDMGFYPELRTIMKRLPAAHQRMTMLFSATLNTRTEQLAWQFMRNPVHISIDAEKKTVREIEQRLYHLAQEEKLPFLINYLRREEPSSALIFTNMRARARDVADRLQRYGLNATFLSGDLPQQKRSKLIDKLKDGTIRYLVVTDIAARGLHIHDLPLVVNYDIPEDSENYVHRIGRTARAGKSGLAISLACERYVYGLEAIEEFIGQKIPLATADTADLTVERPPVSSHVRHETDNGATSRHTRERSRDRASDDRADTRADRGASRPSHGRASHQRTGYRSHTSARSSSHARPTSPDARSSHTREHLDSRRPASSATPSSSRESSYRSHNRSPGAQIHNNDNKRHTSHRSHNRSRNAQRTEGAATRHNTRRASRTPEERLAFYREKYGETFSMDEQSRRGAQKQKESSSRASSSPTRHTARPKKRGLWRKIVKRK